MMKRLLMLSILTAPLAVFAQGGKPVIQAGKKIVAAPKSMQGVRYVPRAGAAGNMAASLERATDQAVRQGAPVPAASTVPPSSAIPPVNLGGSPAKTPRRNLLNKRYPSGLREEEQLINDWLEYSRTNYSQLRDPGQTPAATPGAQEDEIEEMTPRDQVEAIEGMSPRQMNNIIEYLYYMPVEEAKAVIFNPLLETGRLPEFMYDDKLIPGTKRLPAGYYKNKFNKNVKTFVKLADEDGTIYTHNAQLKELMSAMKDYNFKQGFTYTNSSELTNGLRKNWEAMYAEISKPGINSANRQRVNQLWRNPIKLSDGTQVSLRDYFIQRRRTPFFEESMPEFYLNSPKWVALENERRNLIANEYPVSPEQANAFNQLQKRWVLGNPDRYLTLEQFGELMTKPYKDAYGAVRQDALGEGAVSAENDPLLGLKAQTPTSTTIKVNNFDKFGGVCCQSFTDGGFAGRVPQGYDGTSTVNRFEPVVFDGVRVVTFDMLTLQPRVVTLDKVSYVKDLKQPDIDRVRASSMVGDGLDASRDVLTVERAERALHNIPHLRATIYPQERVKGYENVPYMKGGGLAAYLALFTPDFYPIKTVRLLQKVDGKWQWVPTYFVRKEVLALAGAVHRDHLTFTEQVEDRIIDDK